MCHEKFKFYSSEQYEINFYSLLKSSVVGN